MEIVPCRFDLPETLQRFRTASNPHYDTFVIEPIPSGYGLIIGHALRQILCSSLDGAFFDGSMPSTVRRYATSYLLKIVR